MGRTPFCEKIGLKKGPWTPEEDQKLVDYIHIYGYGNWRTLPKNAGLQRCGKSCRLRWTNYLRPDIKRGRFSFEEEETIIQLHTILGNKWSAIAARLPGRTDNEIKNYWNTHIKKRLLRMGIDPATHNPRLDLLDLSSILGSSLYNPSTQMNISRLLGVQPFINPDHFLRLATSMVSSQLENSHILSQNVQENQLNLINSHLQNQVSELLQPDQQGIPTNCTTLSTPCVPFPSDYDHAQLITLQQEKDSGLVLKTTYREGFEIYERQYPSSFIHYNSQNSQINEYPSNAMPSNLSRLGYVSSPSYQGYVDQSIMAPNSYYETSTFTSNNSNLNFNLTSSVLSTSLNSSATCLTCNLENQKEIDYCDNILKYEIPSIFDVNDFMNVIS